MLQCKCEGTWSDDHLDYTFDLRYNSGNVFHYNETSSLKDAHFIGKYNGRCTSGPNRGMTSKGSLDYQIMEVEAFSSSDSEYDSDDNIHDNLPKAMRDDIKKVKKAHKKKHHS